MNNYRFCAECFQLIAESGDIIFIPRILMDCNNVKLPFTVRQTQFPIQLAFSVTINKAQGQTLEKVALNLPSPVFAHGQSYLGLSRARLFDYFKVHIEGVNTGNRNVYIENIVYEELLNREKKVVLQFKRQGTKI